LVQIILEQQVSLASARATFERLRRLVKRLTPAAFSRLDDQTLKHLGFSRQKADYCRSLAVALQERRLRLNEVAGMDDAAAKQALMEQRGIGRWTAEIYLLMALRRPDVWPTGDLALARATQRVKRLKRRPTEAELETIAAGWRPWRAVAARLLWHDYLSRRASRTTAKAAE
jgi:DNA-3-methyladenine glycosylase II